MLLSMRPNTTDAGVFHMVRIIAGWCVDINITTGLQARLFSIGNALSERQTREVHFGARTEDNHAPVMD